VEVEQIWRYVDAERASLAEFLSGLSAAEWATPSLCPGWTVQAVAAHVISSPQARAWPVVTGIIRTRGDFNRLILEEGQRAAASYSPEQIVAQYGQYAGSRRHPLGTTPADPLLDVLIHGQDIAVPLGRHREMPPEAARAAADRIWTKSFPFKARKRLAGVRLVATDIPWAVGEGPEISGPMWALLLLLSGRPDPAHPHLTGPGLTTLHPTTR
jgi:uncharacterized protein (TIGR03083 family)